MRIPCVLLATSVAVLLLSVHVLGNEAHMPAGVRVDVHVASEQVARGAPILIEARLENHTNNTVQLQPMVSPGFGAEGVPALSVNVDGDEPFPAINSYVTCRLRAPLEIKPGHARVDYLVILDPLLLQVLPTDASSNVEVTVKWLVEEGWISRATHVQVTELERETDRHAWEFLRLNAYLSPLHQSQSMLIQQDLNHFEAFLAEHASSAFGPYVALAVAQNYVAHARISARREIEERLEQIMPGAILLENDHAVDRALHWLDWVDDRVEEGGVLARIAAEQRAKLDMIHE